MIVCAGLSFEISLAVKPDIVGQIIALALRLAAVLTAALLTALEIPLLL